MENRSKDVLGKTIVSVLESMAFMFAEIVTKNPVLSIEENTCIHTHIEFSGGRSYGEIGLILSPGLVSSIAKNVMGMESEDIVPHDTVEDMSKEIVNVICGQFLTSMFGDKPIFELSVPDVSRLDSKACSDMFTDPNIVVCMVEDSLILGYVKLEKR